MSFRIISPHQEVFFEGGLGSQLLGVIEYHAKLKIFDGEVLANIDYFTQSKPTNGRHIIRPWRLDDYGFTLEYFVEMNSQNNLQGELFSRPTIRQYSDFALHHRIFEFGESINIALPSKIENTEMQNLLLSERDFGTIHLRRGDYRKVASHLIALRDVLLVIRKQSRALPDTVFFFTDSYLSQIERFRLKKIFREIKKRLLLIEGTNYLTDIEIHGIMRQSKFLIASNSTFSFSSALLNVYPDSMIYVPSIFHTDEASVMNNVYTSIARFNNY